MFEELIKDRISYGNTFYVPQRARWYEPHLDKNGEHKPAILDSHNNLGDILKKSAAGARGRE